MCTTGTAGSVLDVPAPLPVPIIYTDLDYDLWKEIIFDINIMRWLLRNTDVRDRMKLYVVQI